MVRPNRKDETDAPLAVRGRRLVGVCGLLAFALEPARDEARPAPPPTPRVLPGVRPDGDVQLPNSGRCGRPASTSPSAISPSTSPCIPSGKWAAVLHAGYSEHEIVVVELRNDKPRIVSRVSLDQTFYGICFAPDGKTLFASGGEFEVVHAFAFDKGLLSDHREIPVAPVADKFVVAGVAVDAAGRTLFAAGAWGDAVAIVPLDDPNNRRTVALDKGSYPYACLPDPKGGRLFVSLWGKAGVAVIDPAAAKVVGDLARRNRTRRKWPCRPTARRCSWPAPTRRR